MNTIGIVKNEENKVNMSLDEIIRQEPLRYTTTLQDPYIKKYEANRSDTYRGGRKRLQKRGVTKRRTNFANGHCRQLPRIQRQPMKKSPYNHLSFTYNGVHVSSDSSLLNRGSGEVGIVSIVRKKNHKRHDRIQKPKIKERLGMPVIRYMDMSYVRKPVHERLGWGHRKPQDQFRKTRVNLAANFLRQRHHVPNMPMKLMTSGTSRSQDNLNADMESERGLTCQDNGQMQGCIVNEVETELKYIDESQGKVMTDSDGRQVYVAPLSRQNVAQLSDSRLFSPGSSHDTSASRVGVLRSRHQDPDAQSMKDEIFASYNRELQKMQAKQLQDVRQVVQETVQQQMMSFMGGCMPTNSGMMMSSRMMPMMMPYMSGMNVPSAPSVLAETTSNNRMYVCRQDGSVLMQPNSSSQTAPVDRVTNNPTFSHTAHHQHLNGQLQTAVTDVRSNTHAAFDRGLAMPRVQATFRTINDRFSDFC